MLKIILIGVIVVIFPFLSGGSFLMMVPGLGSGVKAIYQVFGYELRCYDLHGGSRCELHESQESIDRRSVARQLRFEKDYGWRTDADCSVTKEGNCVTGRKMAGMLGAAAQRTDHQCVCRQGPVEYGCVTKSMR